MPPPGQLAGGPERSSGLSARAKPEWPTQLAALGDAGPVVLWLRGSADLRFACLRSVSIVGSRAATAYGTHVGTELAAELAGLGWTVISGGAYGIDACAHRGALAVGGARSRCWPAGSASGIRRGTRPVRRDRRQRRDGQRVPPDRAPTRPGFLVRNRVIAALSRGTLVVEAALRSGAINYRGTRPRPEPPGDGGARADHLRAVSGVSRADQELGCRAGDRRPRRHRACRPARRGRAHAAAASRPFPLDDLDPVTASVLRAVAGARGRGPATIAALAGVDLDTALRCLGLLAAAGFMSSAASRAGVPGRQGDCVTRRTQLRQSPGGPGYERRRGGRADRRPAGRVSAPGRAMSSASAAAGTAPGAAVMAARRRGRGKPGSIAARRTLVEWVHLPSKPRPCRRHSMRCSAAFERHLAAGRGLSPHTVRAYVGDVSSLLGHVARCGIDDVAELDISVIRAGWRLQHAAGQSRQFDRPAGGFRAGAHRFAFARGGGLPIRGRCWARPRPGARCPRSSRSDQVAAVLDNARAASLATVAASTPALAVRWERRAGPG